MTAPVYYTNQVTLELAYGDLEVSGLLKDGSGTENAARLEKAAAQAFAEINNVLFTAGYALPLTFSPYTEQAAGDLNGTIQRLSDVITVYHLANSEDLSKARYDTAYQEALTYLEAIRTRDAKIYGLEMTTDPTGKGDAVTIARKRILDVKKPSESQLFCRRIRTVE